MCKSTYKCKFVGMCKQSQVHAHAPIHKKANQQEVENEVAMIDQESTMEKVQFLFYNMTTKSIPKCYRPSFVNMKNIELNEKHKT